MTELSTKALAELLDSPELISAVSEPCACGSPRVLAPGLDSFICPSSDCPFRVAARLYAIAERYGMERELPLSDLEFACQSRACRSWLDFFAEEWGDDFEKDRSKLIEALKDHLDVTTLAILCGFDVISAGKVYSLCGGFRTTSDFVDLLDTRGLHFVAETLGLTEVHLLPAAVHIFNKLSACLGEMVEAEEVFAAR